MAGGKSLIGEVSVILIVAACIGLVSGHPASPAPPVNLKAVEIVCTRVEHKLACVRSLKSLAHNPNATPRDYILTVIQSAINSTKGVAPQTQGVVKLVGNDPFNGKVAEDCQEMLESSADKLQEAYDMVAKTDLYMLPDKHLELNMFIGDACSNVRTCLDEFNREDAKQAMSTVVNKAYNLMENAIKVINHIGVILNEFNIPVIPSPPLAGAFAAIGQDSSPPWKVPPSELN